jgi:hypothetical protein
LRIRLRTVGQWLLALTVAACAADAQDETGANAGAALKPTDLQRLAAATGTEPLLAIGIQDVNTLAERFAGTHLSKMLTDKAYANGLAAIKALLDDGAGVKLSEFLPKAAKLMNGPALAAIVQDGADGNGLTVNIYVLTASDDTARELASVWPKAEDGADAFFKILKLKTLQPKDLPLEGAVLPDWAGKNWPAGDVAVTVLPRKLSKAAERALSDGKIPGIAPNSNLLPLLADCETSPVERLALGVTIDGETFTDELTVELADGDATLKHFVDALKEKPKGWDSLLAALPGDGDLAVMFHSDPKAIAVDLPFAVQGLERYLRGRRWAKKAGVSPEALDAKRFDFLLNRMHGELGISVRPSLTAELHLVMAAAMKSGEIEAIRGELIDGMSGLDAGFDTLQNVSKIGNNAPLGAKFKGRGIFAAPVIGISPGWAWLCTNLATYQDVVSAFGAGKTLGAALKQENARLKAAGQPEPWRSDDAFRLQINLEKVVQLGYTAWLLSGEQPVIGNWQMPPALLPPPQLLMGHLGTLRAGLSRNGKVLNAYSRCIIPGAALIGPGLLQALAEATDQAREFAKNPPPPPPERAAINRKKPGDTPEADPPPKEK